MMIIKLNNNLFMLSFLYSVYIPKKGYHTFKGL